MMREVRPKFIPSGSKKEVWVWPKRRPRATPDRNKHNRHQTADHLPFTGPKEDLTPHEEPVDKAYHEEIEEAGAVDVADPHIGLAHLHS